MDSGSSDQSDSPKRLKTLASSVQFSGGNTLLHRLVLENSHPDDAGSEIYVRAVLISMSDVPANEVNALNDEGFTALHLAVLKNNLLLVTKLLSYLTNIDVNTKCGRDDGNTALHLAVESGHLSIIQELLDKGADIHIFNGADWETPLMVAMKLRALETVKILVGADVNQLIPLGSPLHLTARYGSLEIAEFLIDEGADVEARDVQGSTPLHEAASRGRVEIAEFLIDAGADIDAICRNGRRPLQNAAHNGHLDTVKLLVVKGADLHPTDGRTALYDAMWNGGSAVATFLLDQGAPLNAADERGLTPLHEAAYTGHADLVRVLLDRGADANARDVFGQTPLHDAAVEGHVDVVLALLDRGADANARDEDGRTPLDIARARQNQACIDALQNVG